MKTYYGFKAIKKARLRNPVVTIGTFDGVHRGHQRLLKKLIGRAGKLKGDSLVVTFDPHPQRVITCGSAPASLISLEHRLWLFAEAGIDYAWVINFGREFSRLSPLDFVKRVLVQSIGAREVVVAGNFHFGCRHQGDVKRLKSIAGQFGIRVIEVSLAKLSSRVISSTEIRRLIKQGKLIQAERRLGRRVSILGTVRRGDAIGRVLGFPTANIDPHHEVVPPSGVYAVLAQVRGCRYKGVLNIGFRPKIELHIFGFKGNLYNCQILVEFIKRIRPERRFKTRYLLIRQIDRDILKVKRILLYK